MVRDVKVVRAGLHSLSGGSGSPGYSPAALSWGDSYSLDSLSAERSGRLKIMRTEMGKARWLVYLAFPGRCGKGG